MDRLTYLAGQALAGFLSSDELGSGTKGDLELVSTRAQLYAQATLDRIQSECSHELLEEREAWCDVTDEDAVAFEKTKNYFCLACGELDLTWPG